MPGIVRALPAAGRLPTISWECEVSSELVPESKLDNPRVGGGLHLSEGFVYEVTVRLAEVGPVQRIEELGAELQPAESLVNAEALHQRQIGIECAWTTEEVASSIAI